MTSRDQTPLAVYLGLIFLYVAMTVGWVMNIVTIWKLMDNEVTTKFIIRVVGIFVFPIGAVLGYL